MKTGAALGWTVTALTLLALVVGVAKKWNELAFNNGLSLGDGLQVLATIAVATWIAHVVERAGDRNRFVVALLSDELRFVHEKLNTIESFYDRAATTPQGLPQCHEILMAFRQTVNRIGTITKELHLLGLDARHEHACAELRTTIVSLKQVATSEGFPVDGFQTPVALRGQITRSLEAARLSSAAFLKALVS